MFRLLFLTSFVVICSCGGENTDSYVDAPGKEKDAKSRTLETGADILQDKTPLKRMNTYLNALVIRMHADPPVINDSLD